MSEQQQSERVYPFVQVARVGLRSDGLSGATGIVELADWVEVLPVDQAAAIIRMMAQALEYEAQGFELRAHMADPPTWKADDD